MKPFLFFFFTAFLASIQFSFAQYSGGSGTSGDPYQISTLDDLSELCQTTADWSGKYFIQTANIDASQTQYWDDIDDNSDGDKYNDPNDATSTGLNYGFSPIGNSTTKWNSSYDGDGYYISGITIDRKYTDCIGFFGYTDMSGKTIENLGLTNANIWGYSYVGGMFGYGRQGIVQNCYVDGNITGGGSVGGFIGAASSIDIDRCYSKGSVNDDNMYSSRQRYGGFAGSNDWGYFDNCYSHSSVSCNANINGTDYIGGFIGYHGYGGINDCYSKGFVFGRSYVGGFAGYQNQLTITTCFFDYQTAGTSSSAGGTAANTLNMTQSGIFTNAGWDFVGETTNGTNDYWDVNSSINDSYPYLSWESFGPSVTTQAVSDISMTTATGNGNITFIGGENITERGIYYSTTNGFADGAGTKLSTTGNWSSTGTFTQAITNLASNTTYYVKAFATNSNGTAYGSQVSFTTLSNTNTEVFQYTGSHQYWTVPSGITQITVKAWGAGGGGRTGSYAEDTGGSGGYTEASLNVTPGQQLCITVGQGGQRGATDGGNGGWPGGGYGTKGDASGSGGGGVTGVFLSSYAHGNALIITGAGGGGGYQPGGSGGGTIGGNGQNTGSSGGYGATQSAGGTGTDGDDGSALQGGNGDKDGFQTSLSNDGCGGGAGYYGGEGGSNDAGGGGGGSSYANPSYLTGSATFTQGNSGAYNAAKVDPPNISDDDYVAGVGIGTGSSYSYGGNGLVVISYSYPFEWNGSTSNDWNTASNWSGGTVPTDEDNVIIANAGTAPVIESGETADCNNLTINSGATLTVASGGSLITEGTITNNGTIDIGLSVSDSKWHYISSPNNNTLSGLFEGQYLQYWTENEQLWTDIGDMEWSLTPTKGYSLWGVSSKGNYTFTGTPNNGEQSIQLSYHENLDPLKTADGMNLVGNPYPSSIDWFGLHPTYGTAYVWNPDASAGAGDYIEQTSGDIAPMQGFFIYTTNDGSSFTLQNSNRSHGGTFYKNEKKNENEILLLASNGSYADELRIIIDEQANEQFELTKDAWKLISNGNGVSQLWTVSSSGKLAIDSRPEQETIQLGFANNQNGVYSIALQDATNQNNLSIEDTKLNHFHDLTKGAYSFDWNTNDSEERFILHLKATGTEDLEASELAIYSLDGRVYIRQNETNRWKEARVYDLAGRVVYETPLNNEVLQSFELNQSVGAYLVQLVGKNSSLTEKVILK